MGQYAKNVNWCLDCGVPKLDRGGIPAFKIIETAIAMTAERIDIKDSAVAVQGYLALIKKRIKGTPHEQDEAKRMCSRAILRLERLKTQVGECYKE